MAHQRKLQTQSERMLLPEELRHIVAMLESLAWEEAGELRISWDGFTQVAAWCLENGLGAATGPVFNSQAFLKFDRDSSGAASLALLTQYIHERNRQQQQRLQLARYDLDHCGWLAGPQLEALLADLAQQAPALQGMEPSFLPHYVKITARKVLFFHGSRKPRAAAAGGRDTRAVRLCDLVASPIMAEIQELQAMSGDESYQDLSTNWFSLQSAQRVHNTFCSWDADSSGGLSKSEFSRISQGAMTDLFIGRVFEEHVAGSRRERWPPLPPGAVRPARPAASPQRRDEMDMLAFVDFVLAWDHRSHSAAIPYFFAIYDTAHRGALRQPDLYTFFREVHAMWLAMGEYSDLCIHDVLDEIFDMVQPVDAARGITSSDLASCKIAGTVFGMLANVDQFYQYNYREQFMNKDDEQ